MKRKKIDSKIEETICTAMITSKDYLSQIAPILDLNLLRGSHFQLVAKWCISYFNRYHKAPGKHIENRFNSWSNKGTAKEEMVDAVHDILAKMSDNFDENYHTNIPYLLDEAQDYLSIRKIANLRDILDEGVEQNNSSVCESALNSFRLDKIMGDGGIDMFNDENSYDRAFNQTSEPLFTIGTGKVQQFFKHAFCRDNLIGVLGPEKRGKTFWCYEFAIRALMARRKVAMFQVGDLSESQAMMRSALRITGIPQYKSFCGRIRIPIRIRKQGEEIKIRTKTQFIKNPLTLKKTMEGIAKFKRRHAIPKDQAYFMTSIHPNFSCNVADINSMLDRWEIEKDFVPDVIIIDYPDILADEPNTGNYQKRDKENVKWMALRRLSQERHCCVIVPTQADAASYTAEWLSASNFSEDKRKLAHVTGMLGLNQTADEKEMNLMRLNWIVLREAPFSINRGLYVGQCLNIGRAFCCGYY